MPTHRFAGVLLVDGMSFQDDLQIGRTRSMFRLIVLVEGEEGSCTLISITRKKNKAGRDIALQQRLQFQLPEVSFRKRLELDVPIVSGCLMVKIAVVISY